VNDHEWKTLLADWEAELGEPLTGVENRVFELLFFEEKRPEEIADAVQLPLKAVNEIMGGLIGRIVRATEQLPDPDPSPDPPIAAGAALAVPVPMDIPKHVGHMLRPRGPRPA
jgi:hypothetical protein